MIRERKFYQIIDNTNLVGRWFLGSPMTIEGHPIDPETFTYGTVLRIAGPLVVGIRQHGHPLDFTFADFDMPVLSMRCVKILARIVHHNMQMIPARVEGYPGDYAVVNFTGVVSCIDEQASVFTRWQENDGRPDKIGQFRQMTQLQLDQSKIPPTDKIFRVAGWDVALVVSEEIKNRLKDESVTGLGFVEV